MAICPELVHKFKQYSAACGLGNPKDLENWIEIAEEISSKHNIHEDKVYLLFSKTAAKPLKRFKRDSGVWNNVLKSIAGALNQNQKVTKKMVEFWLCENGVPLKTETVLPGKIAKKVIIDPSVVTTGDIKGKIYALKSALTPGQIQILNEIMVRFDHEDEIGAVSLALIWAKERMDNE